MKFEKYKEYYISTLALIILLYIGYLVYNSPLSKDVYQVSEVPMEAPIEGFEAIDKNFNGIKRNYYKSGLLESETSWKDGKLNGISKAYSEDGTLKKESTFKDMKLITEKTYYEIGELKDEIIFNDNNKTRIHTTYKKNGDLEIEKIYTDNILSSMKHYGRLGVLISEEAFKKGITNRIKKYSTTGQLESEFNFENETGFNNGNYTKKRFHATGELLSEENYKNNIRNGMLKIYSITGELEVEINFINGKAKSGLYYNNDGSIGKQMTNAHFHKLGFEY